MIMPLEPIETTMFAPCGMNCMVCYKHCCHKKPCAGCFKSDMDKPEHCRKCRIKACAKEKAVAYCYECTEYPCTSIKNLEKSYITRYGASLMANSRYVKEKGLAAFMEQQKITFTCPECGGVVSIHDSQCSECQRRAAE